MNEYRGAASGIGWHNDGPLFEPRVAIVSLGTPTLLYFTDSAADPVAEGPPRSVLLRPRSLLVFTGHAYTHMRHGIPPLPVPAPSPRVVDELCLNLALCPGAALGDPLPAEQARRSLTVRRIANVQRGKDDVWSPQDKEEHRRRLVWWRGAISER